MGGTSANTDGEAGGIGDAGNEVATSSDAQSPDTTKPDPLQATMRCTSNAYWSRGNHSLMAPGQACIACHQRSGEGPLYTIAGTLYPTGHEPDNCNGVSSATSGAQVIVTGANGAVLTLTANSAGNFYTTIPVAMPYNVKVVDGNGIERSMFTTSTDGDCNRCHTQNGTNAAPGRVTLP
jgi:cytochrome c553